MYCVPTWDTLIACVMENDMFESCHRRFCIILSLSTWFVRIVWFYFPEWYNQVRILAGERIDLLKLGLESIKYQIGIP